ncbi:Quercetin 2,3-dioxygenase [Chlamydiales bacterium STE3]|nr:Quercetin 2,3-dioxygenase [Chlamydiales bacterium STE3]
MGKKKVITLPSFGTLRFFFFLLLFVVITYVKDAMMSYEINKGKERKFFDHGWLKTFHTFSFASYYDSRKMGFRSLRVINEDQVDPNHGFPLHEHKNMEIISIVLKGNLAHRDSMGNEVILHPNEIQVMSAGTGIKHSEYNPSPTSPAHFLQIWIVPDTKNSKPHYQQAHLPTTLNEWHLIASQSKENNSLQIQQDVGVYFLLLESEEQVSLPTHRYGWLQVIDGSISFYGTVLEQGDSIAVQPETPLVLKGIETSRLLFFDLN